MGSAQLLQKSSSSKLGVDIHIDKVLPMGGGIGGGSSNAATTLWALNRLWDVDYSDDKLKQLGVQLGADVPIFIHGHSAWAEGVGEKLTNIDCAEPWYVLLLLDCHVETKAIFSHSQLTRDTKITRIAAFVDHIESESDQSEFRNDCEPLVRSLYPQVDDALIALSKFGKARMTGTGACVFASYNTQQEAEKVCRQLPKQLQAWVTKGLNQSPLITSLKQLNTQNH